MPAVGGSSVIISCERNAGANYLSTFQHIEFNGCGER
jgi:hypothetical protein